MDSENIQQKHVTSSDDRTGDLLCSELASWVQATQSFKFKSQLVHQ